VAVSADPEIGPGEGSTGPWPGDSPVPRPDVDGEPAGRSSIVLGRFVPEPPDWRDGPDPPRRRPPLVHGGEERTPRWPKGVRVMAWVVAGSLVLGVLASGVGVVFGGAGAPAYTVDVSRVAHATGTNGAADAKVSFAVTNSGGGAGQPVCKVQVFSGGRAVGSKEVRASGLMPAGATVGGNVAVPVAPASAASSPLRAAVDCSG